MNKVFSTLIFLFFCGTLPAQDTLWRSPKNTIHFESGGNAIYYSVNYSRLFMDDHRFGNAGRIGLSLMPASEYVSYQVPLEFTWLLGKRRHYFEFGPGMTFLGKVYAQFNRYNSVEDYVDRYMPRINAINANFRIGYCFIPLKKNRLFMRAAFTPIFLITQHGRSPYVSFKNVPIIWTGGVSIGWAF